MKKLKISGLLLLMAFALSACATTPHMVKCPECGKVFDSQNHKVDRYGH